MNLRLFFLKRLGNIAFSVGGFAGGIALATLGYTWNNPFLIAAGAFATFLGVVLFWIDAILFAQAGKQVFDLAEKATELINLQLSSSPRAAASILDGRGVEFVDASEADSAREPSVATAVVTAAPATGVTTAPTNIFGSIELRTRSFDSGAVSDLEFIEQLAKEVPFQFGKKRLVVSAVGSTLIDEPTLGDFIEGNLAFNRLAFPEIIPGIDLLAAAELSEFRSGQTLKEAVQIAARGYERTILVVSENQFAQYQELFSQRSSAGLFGNRLNAVVQTIDHVQER